MPSRGDSFEVMDALDVGDAAQISSPGDVQDAPAGELAAPPAGTVGGMPDPVSPFVFVAATRYAIRRTLTSASEEISRQVLMHAELIRSDPGAAGAIRREVEDFVDHFDMLEMGQTQAELDALKRRWQLAADALR